MANGTQRDSIRTDILNHRLPTLSPAADDTVARIARLSDTKQLEALERDVDQWLAGLNTPAVLRWLSPPWIYLADLEPNEVAHLTRTLEDILAERLQMRATVGGRSTKAPTSLLVRSSTGRRRAAPVAGGRC